jgi:CHASE3 domain sensor protein/anti-anti-sigma regulatory factor
MRRWFNNARIRTKILVCAIAILLIVGAMSAVVYNSIDTSQARDQLVEHADAIVMSTDALQVYLTNIELAFRSYLLTGDKVWLTSYDKSNQAYDTEFVNLQALVRDDPQQSEQLRQIDLEVQGWRIYVHQVGIGIRKRLGKRPSAASDAFTATGFRGKQDYDDIRSRLVALRSAEAQLADIRRQEAQTSTLTLRVTLLTGTLVVSVLCLGTLSLLASNIARRVGRVTWAAERIATGDNTIRCDLPDSHDEVGLMATMFNSMANIIQQRTDDLTSQYTVVEAARCAAEASHAQIAQQLDVIDQQQALIRDISVPVLPLLASTLVMPLVGALDSKRLMLMQEQALHALERSSARQLILDITGVPIVDTQVALGLMQLVQAAQLLGTRVSIVGIRPEVAQALVGLGISLSNIKTFSTLQLGVAQAIAAEARSNDRLVRQSVN